ncbi:MAG: hypothetical protein AAF685_14160 [Cyanobacteria bacterium P01_C01_bin.89]
MSEPVKPTFHCLYKEQRVRILFRKYFDGKGNKNKGNQKNPFQELKNLVRINLHELFVDSNRFIEIKGSLKASIRGIPRHCVRFNSYVLKEN